VFVAEDESGVVGSYDLHTNQLGGGDHVANCGYMVRGDAAGRAVAAAMCRHSMDHARAAGFTAMQFNFVVSMNERAIAPWERLGIEIVGRPPGEVRHPTKGQIDAVVMVRALSLGKGRAGLAGARPARDGGQLTGFQMMTFFEGSSPGAGATLP